MYETILSLLVLHNENVHNAIGLTWLTILILVRLKNTKYRRCMVSTVTLASGVTNQLMYVSANLFRLTSSYFQAFYHKNSGLWVGGFICIVL